MSTQNDVSYIYGNYITPSFIMIVQNLYGKKTSLLDCYEHIFNPGHTICLVVTHFWAPRAGDGVYPS
jgi:hypothetical protein